MDNCPETLKKGHILHGNGEYKVTHYIGNGTFGITYKVKGRLQNIPVDLAIKEYFHDDTCTRMPDGSVCAKEGLKKKFDKELEEFITEATRLNKADVHHNNLLPINEVFKEGGTAYYVMEFLEGDNLNKTMEKRKNRPFSEEEAIGIIAPTAEAIDALHAVNIAHLDLSHNNIILSPQEDGTFCPTVIDFGLSKHYDKNGKMTTEFERKLTPGFAPIEQYFGDVLDFSPCYDVYALGANLFFMLTGKVPVSSAKINSEYITEELDKSPVAISERTRNALIHAMKKDKDERTSSVAEFLSELGVNTGVSHTVTIALEEDSNKKDRTGGKKALLGLLAAGLVVAAVALGLRFVPGMYGGDSEDKTAEEVATEETVTTPDATVVQPEESVAAEPEPAPMPVKEPEVKPEPTPAPAPAPRPTPKATPKPAPTPAPTPAPATAATITLPYGVCTGNVVTVTKHYELENGISVEPGDKITDAEFSDGELSYGVIRSPRLSKPIVYIP